MNKRLLSGGLGLALLLGGIAWQKAAYTPDLEPQATHPLPAASYRLDAGMRLSVSDRDIVAHQLGLHDGFERDLLFLLNSSLYGRCHPGQAHDMGRMAVAAHLPVLDAMARLWRQDPSLRDQLYAMIRSVAADSDCDRPPQLVIGSYTTSLRPERYAAFFPDSYFDPALAAAPGDFAGRSLADRASDPCTAIGYAVLPLGGDRSWVCVGARTAMRRHVVADLCDSAFDRGQSDAAMQMGLAKAIDASLQTLPPVCR